MNFIIQKLLFLSFFQAALIIWWIHISHDAWWWRIPLSSTLTPLNSGFQKFKLSIGQKIIFWLALDFTYFMVIDMMKKKCVVICDVSSPANSWFLWSNIYCNLQLTLNYFIQEVLVLSFYIIPCSKPNLIQLSSKSKLTKLWSVFSCWSFGCFLGSRLYLTLCY